MVNRVPSDSWHLDWWATMGMTDVTPATIVCTLGKDDSGALCPFCGHPTGGGHGKKRSE